MCIRDRSRPGHGVSPGREASSLILATAVLRQRPRPAGGIDSGRMPLTGNYEPSPAQWVRDQVELYESSGGTEGTTLRGMPVVVITSRGAKSGTLRKNPVMRVEHDGRYAACLLYTSPSPRDRTR